MRNSQNESRPIHWLLWILVALNLFIAVFLLIKDLSGNDKIVFVDAQRLVNGYTGMKDARREFELKAGSWNAHLDTLKIEVKSRIEEYEANAAKLSAKERSLMEELIQTKQQQYMNYQQVVAEKIKTADQELTSKVLTDVNEYIKKYGSDHGYAIILAATQYGNIAFGQVPLDITDDVLKGLNAGYGN